MPFDPGDWDEGGDCPYGHEVMRLSGVVLCPYYRLEGLSLRCPACQAELTLSDPVEAEFVDYDSGDWMVFLCRDRQTALESALQHRVECEVDGYSSVEELLPFTSEHGAVVNGFALSSTKYNAAHATDPNAPIAVQCLTKWIYVSEFATLKSTRVYGYDEDA